MRLWVCGMTLGACLGLPLCSGCDRGQPVTEKKAAVAPQRKVPAEAPRPPKEERGPEPAPEPEPAPKATVVDETARPADDDVFAADPLDDPDPKVPPVVMTNQHAATCLVHVGDMLPDVTLRDIAGTENQLAELLGERATVVVFWSPGNQHSLVELSDLAHHVASPLAAMGIKVVGICELDSLDTAKIEAAKTAGEKQGASFPLLVDDGKYYGQVATSKLPRTYLLNPAGEIVWLDIEYSRGTRRDLRQALRAILNQ